MADSARWVPRLVVLSDTTRAECEPMLDRYAALAELAIPRCVLVVLRDYTLPVRERWRLGERLAALCERAQQAFGVAESADLARALQARAFHLPAAGLQARDARDYLGPSVFLSRGGHAPDEAPEPELDAWLLSPIFEPRKGRLALGVAALTRAARMPGGQPALFALGGVEAHNAASCLGAGAAGVAVIGAALEPDPEPLLRALGILRG